MTLIAVALAQFSRAVARRLQNESTTFSGSERMSVDALEHGLLKRSLTDPTTGLPNRLYLEVIRSWEETRAKRDGAKVFLLAVVPSGGTEQVRRMLAVRL